MSHTIASIKEGLAKKEFSVTEITRSYADRIAKENPHLNAFLEVFSPDEFLPTNDRGSLYGVPCGIKDNMLLNGKRTTSGSKILENYISSYTATAVTKLREAGGVILGKLNMDEFAMGSSTENSAFGPTKNPHDLTRVPGGSSGGSAAAVAADLCVFALGSDTGGSIRQPAALCGVVGLKPTYGRVSRHGLIAMASSLDQIGPLTKTVQDSAIVFETLAGHDVFDSTTINESSPNIVPVLNEPIKGLRVGVPKEFFGAGLDAEVAERVQGAIKKLEELGAEIVEVSLPHAEYALATYYLIMPCEVSANLARLDGIRYGYSEKGSSDLLHTYLESRAHGFGAEPKRRIMLGTYALSSGYYDAYYLKAQKVRALIRKDFDDAFQDVDVIVGPTSPSVAFRIGEKSSDPLSMYLSDIYTVPINLAGVPAISVPVGKGSTSGMPVGFQIIGKMFDEATLLRVAHQLEQAQ